MADVERPVAVHPGGGECGEAPENCAGDDEGLAAIAVTEPAGEWRGQHVDEEHGGGERAHLLAGGVEFILDEGEFAGKDIAVDVVEQVEGDEEDERGEGGTDARAGCCIEGRQVVSSPACFRLAVMSGCSISVTFALRLPRLGADRYFWQDFA